MMQHDSKTEFLLQPQHRHDVVCPVRVMMHDAAALHGLDQGLEVQVAGRQFVGIAFGLVDLVLIFAGLDVLLADQECAFAASAGKGS